MFCNFNMISIISAHSYIKTTKQHTPHTSRKKMLQMLAYIFGLEAIELFLLFFHQHLELRERLLLVLPQLEAILLVPHLSQTLSIHAIIRISLILVFESRQLHLSLRQPLSQKRDLRRLRVSINHRLILDVPSAGRISQSIQCLVVIHVRGAHACNHNGARIAPQ